MTHPKKKKKKKKKKHGLNTNNKTSTFPNNKYEEKKKKKKKKKKAPPKNPTDQNKPINNKTQSWYSKINKEMVFLKKPTTDKCVDNNICMLGEAAKICWLKNRKRIS